ncbi:uncharacterized protein BO66DRAFT_473997 [Aspergillus aculeatinus CBS 121060]|uniref:Uncharacterized protein n=1 Tax=Aspergillus aculeatinus CBS 121060 TaxID=1448322 RepID=A0ACD1GZK4_9EURO|nr:hypothetical protein BO66DRAFT_473997 [Aspergillus aculeatinus CBS 121060]RAH66654.1 hypothetical protein BO66DRAFT_473997 [Aspergillus aculeatinus CBS 121060]
MDTQWINSDNLDLLQEAADAMYTDKGKGKGNSQRLADKITDNRVPSYIRGELQLPRRKLAPPPHATTATARPIVHANIVTPGRKGSTSGIPSPARTRSNSHPTRPVFSSLPTRSKGPAVTPATAPCAPRTGSPPVMRCHRCQKLLDDSPIIWNDYPGGRPGSPPRTTRWHSYCLFGLIAEDTLRLIPQKEAPKSEAVAAKIFNRFFGGVMGSS